MTDKTINLSTEDFDMIWFLASTKPCSLEVKKGDDDNWIERAGGALPNYICVVAKGVMKSGKSRSAAIAIAISRIKKWAAGGDDVDADTVAKSAKALAEWEKLKAKNAAKKLIKASSHCGDYIILSEVSEYSLDEVRNAWEARTRQLNQMSDEAGIAGDRIYSWATEVWSTYIIVSHEIRGEVSYFKVPYTVDTEGVQFDIPEPIEKAWVPKTSE